MSLNTYVINLDKDKKRWERHSQELKKVGLQPIRIPGILGKDVTTEFIRNHITVACEAMCPMSVIGCTASHIKAMKTFYDNDPAPFALIVEDDAYPTFKNVSTLNQFIETIPPPTEWDIYMLHCDGKCPTRTEAPVATFLSGSGAAYLVSRRGCEKIIKGVE